MLKNWKKIIAGLVMAGTIGFSGCKNPLDIPENKDPTPLPVSTIYGIVKDQTSDTGVVGAKVSLKINGVWKSVYTQASNNAEGILDSAGNFAMTVPHVVTGPDGAAPGVWLVIEQGNAEAAYLTELKKFDMHEKCKDVAGNCSYDIGEIVLETGLSVTVYVVDELTGQYVTKTDNAVLPISVEVDAADYGNMISPVQDETDTNKYTINVPKNDDDIQKIRVSPIDTDDDGISNYESNEVFVTPYDKEIGSITKIIPVTEITPTTTLSVVSNSAISAGSNGGGTSLTVLNKTGVIKLFFNMPIALVEDETDSFVFRYNNNMQLLTAEATTDTEVAVTPALSLNNTLLTLTPTADLTESENYSVGYGSIRTTQAVSGADEIFGSDEVAGLVSVPTSFWVTRTGTGSLGSTPSVTLDNFNYCTNGAKITTSDTSADSCATGGASATQVYAIFPDQVWGEIQIRSFIDGSSTTEVYNTSVTITGQGSEPNAAYFGKDASSDADIAFNDCGGASESCSGSNYGDIGFRVALTGFTSLDDLTAEATTDTAKKAQVAFDVYDAEGNTYRKEVILGIQ